MYHQAHRPAATLLQTLPAYFLDCHASRWQLMCRMYPLIRARCITCTQSSSERLSVLYSSPRSGRSTQLVTATSAAGPRSATAAYQAIALRDGRKLCVCSVIHHLQPRFSVRNVEAPPMPGQHMQPVVIQKLLHALHLQLLARAVVAREDRGALHARRIPEMVARKHRFGRRVPEADAARGVARRVHELHAAVEVSLPSCLASEVPRTGAFELNLDVSDARADLVSMHDAGRAKVRRPLVVVADIVSACRARQSG